MQYSPRRQIACHAGDSEHEHSQAQNLEQLGGLLNYSDSQEDQANVGPQMDGEPGKFASLVQETYDKRDIVPARRTPKKPDEASKGRRQAALQPLRTGLYEHLPLPERVTKS